MNNYEKEKVLWYNQIYDKPTLWYQMPNEYIDYNDANFWKLFSFVIQRLRLNYEETLITIDAQNHLSEIPEEYRSLDLCLLALSYHPATTLKYIPEHLKTKEMCEIAFLANPKSNFKYIPDKFKTETMCVEAYKANHKNARFIPEIYQTLDIKIETNEKQSNKHK